jgi:hypothetical protein
VNRQRSNTPESPLSAAKGKGKKKRGRSNTQAKQDELDVLERKERQLAIAKQEFELQKAKEEWAFEIERQKAELAAKQRQQ